MQETLYDNQGYAIAYLDYNDENTIYLWDGTPCAYLDDNREIYGFNGKHLGWLEDGVLWDLNGHRAGCNKTALQVFSKFEPFKSFKKFKPFKSFKEFAKFKPFKSTSTSNLELREYLKRGMI